MARHYERSAAAYLLATCFSANVQPQSRLACSFPGPCAAWVLLAVEGAARRLNDPRCQEVLSDFSDRQGQPLRAGLEERGQTLAQHLHDVWLLDGGTQTSCSRRATSAFTVPGGRLVFMCPRLFRRQEGKYDEILLIHEILHTLGLGENPPSSDAITKQVAMRCGDSWEIISWVESVPQTSHRPANYNISPGRPGTGRRRPLRSSPRKESRA